MELHGHFAVHSTVGVISVSVKHDICQGYIILWCIIPNLLLVYII